MYAMQVVFEMLNGSQQFDISKPEELGAGQLRLRYGTGWRII